MRNLRWRIRFKTIKNRDAVVNIYKEGYEGPDVTELEGAEGVIETDEDSSDELLSPIRAQTGYLRVVDNGDIEGLVPSDNMQHYVELTIDGDVKWCGYMQADTFSEDWDVPPVVVEFPLISGLGVLEGCYLDQTKPMVNVRLDELMRECLDMAKVEYRTVYIALEGNVTAMSEYTTFHYMCVSRANFFTENGTENEGEYMKYDAMTAIDVLAEIMKFMGWSMYEHGRDIYMVAHGVYDWEGMPNKMMYGVLQYAQLGVKARYNRTNAERHEIAISSLKWDGDTHSRSVLQGKKKMKVVANFNPVGEVGPIVDKNALGRKGLMNILYEVNGWDANHEQIKLYGGGNDIINTEFYQYEFREGTMKPIAFDERQYHLRVGGCFGEYDFYTIIYENLY